MDFLYPIYIAGALTMAVPILIHLLTRRQRKRILFSDLVLLRKVDAEEAARYRWEHVRLLALRAFMCGVLAILFCQPVLKLGSGLLRRPGQGNAVALVIDSMTRAVFSFLVLLVVCVLIIVACDVFMDYDFVFSWSALLFPFAVLPMFAFTLGLGFYLALLNAIIRDVGQIIGLMMTFLMLLTPVLYEQPPAESAFTIGKVLSSYNPLYYLSVGPRDLILHGKIASQEGYLVSAGIAVLLLVFGAISFHLTENRVAERI